MISPTSARSCRWVLEDLGQYRVTAAATGDQALPLLDSDRPDLLLLDAVLPGMSGIELAAHGVYRNIPVLVMTGEPGMDERLERVGWPHLRKPFHIRELVTEVQETIAQARENSRIIRASLDRLFQTSGDFAARSRQTRQSAPGGSTDPGALATTAN